MTQIINRVTPMIVKERMDDSAIAIGNADGSWWVDWPAVESVAAEPLPLEKCLGAFHIMLCRLLVGARASLTEVTKERADEIALEAGVAATRATAQRAVDQGPKV